MPEVRAVIYARCSTDESRQDVDVQLKELRRYAEASSWVYDEIAEYGSGFKEEQPKLKEIIEKIRRKQYAVLLVHSLDRFSRQHPSRVNVLLDEIVYDHGCRFVSLKEGLDSRNEMIWHVVRPLFSYFANVFSKQLSEKVKAGILNKKAKGLYRGGRPRKTVNLERLRSILASNGRVTLRELETRYNLDLPKRDRVSYQTLRRATQHS